MRKTKKILSVISALAMILSMFSTFVVANADATVGIKTEVTTEGDYKKGDTVTVNFSLDGITTEKVRTIGFTANIDTTKFEVVPYKYVNDDDEEVSDPIETKISGGKSNVSGSEVLYSFVDGAGKKIKAPFAVLTLKLKEDLTEKTTMTLTSGVLADGNGTEYKQAANTMYADSIVVEGATVKANVGIKAEVATEGNYKKGDTVTVNFSLDGITTEKIRTIGFTANIDTTKFEVVPYKYVNDDEEEVSDPIETKISGGKSNVSGSEVLYSFVDGAGKKIKAPFAVLTLKLKEDLTEKTTMTLTSGVLADGNGTEYKQAANTMYADSIVVDPAGSTPSTTYTVTVDSANIKNGTVTVDKATVAEGDKVTITAKADEGYEVDTITVKDADDKTVTVAADGTFTMPASNVTVTATFKKAETTGSKYPYAVNVSKGTTTTIGTKYTVTYTKNADYTETAPETFDVAVQVYNSSNEAAGYMIFKGVKATDTITFYIPKNSTAAVNTVDSFDDSNDNLGNLVAPREKK